MRKRLLNIDDENRSIKDNYRLSIISSSIHKKTVNAFRSQWTNSFQLIITNKDNCVNREKKSNGEETLKLATVRTLVPRW